ncbi:hypothetical protein BpHYR1_034646, partial [Brachionus plicatilis]
MLNFKQICLTRKYMSAKTLQIVVVLVDRRGIYCYDKLIAQYLKRSVVRSQFPWYDDDLICLKHSRDISYKKFKLS